MPGYDDGPRLRIMRAGFLIFTTFFIFSKSFYFGKVRYNRNMNSDIIRDIKSFFRGDIDAASETLEKYSHDASLFVIRPSLVVYPRDAADVGALVTYITEKKKELPDLSITVRSAGTCMSGGAVNDSIIMDVTRYMNRIIEVTDDYAVVEPGCFYRDFEKATLAHNRIMPAFTASKDLCAMGGMFGNNSGGEKTLRYGKFEKYILESRIIFSDGKEYVVKPLSQSELDAKIAQGDFEGNLYKSIFETISKNYEAIGKAKPVVSKNSAGYYLWNVWDRERGVFDLNKLLVGSQGTLGIVTQIKLGLVPVAPATRMLVIFLPDIHRLGELATAINQYHPDSVESFDDASLRLAMKFLPDLLRQMGLWRAIGLAFRYIPEALMMLRGKMPKLIVLVEVCENSDEIVETHIETIRSALIPFGYPMRTTRSTRGGEKYWRIRHESFNLLRRHVRGMHTAPFIDDVVVPVSALPEFLPRLTAILDRENILYTIAGHVADGNFHIIPLMDFKDPKTRDIILRVSDEVYGLVLSYSGSLTAEHNDGLIRTPFIERMFGPFITTLFKQVKTLFDPENIFNPRKKVGATREYSAEHMRED